MIHLTAKLVAAYVGRNAVPAGEVPALIVSAHAALTGATSSPSARPAQQDPFVSIKKSVTPDAIICLECGKSQKMLKRHLTTAHGLSADDYRSKWALPADYPVVAPNYARRRSQLAIKIGLGRPKDDTEHAGSGSDGATAGDSGDDEGMDGQSSAKPRHQYPPSRWSRSTD